MKKTERYLDDLFLLAQDVVPCGNARLAAAVVYKRQIVGIGVNQRKSHTMQKRFGRNDESVYLHSEICAIRNSINRMSNVDFLRSSTLLVARAKIVEGKWVRGLAKCCDGCMMAVNAFGIPRVKWTEDESSFS